jgi:hypothetical protein
MEVICLEDNAFLNLVDRVVTQIKETTKRENKWLPTEKAMEKLQIKSRNTLQKLRDEGCIRITHPEKKWILYDSDSINE